MKNKISLIKNAVKATDKIRSNIHKLDIFFSLLEWERENKIKYDKDLKALMFNIIKIKEAAKDIVGNMKIDTANSDYNPAYFFPDTYRAANSIYRLYEEILDLYNCCKLELGKEDERTD